MIDLTVAVNDYFVENVKRLLTINFSKGKNNVCSGGRVCGSSVQMLNNKLQEFLHLVHLERLFQNLVVFSLSLVNL